MRSLGLESIYFRARQLSPVISDGAGRLITEPALIRAAHCALPSLKPKDAICRSLGIGRLPVLQETYHLLQFCIPCSNVLSATPWHIPPSLGLWVDGDKPHFWSLDATGMLILLLSLSFREKPFPFQMRSNCLSKNIYWTLSLPLVSWKDGFRFWFHQNEEFALFCKIRDWRDFSFLFFFFLHFLNPKGQALTIKRATSDCRLPSVAPALPCRPQVQVTHAPNLRGAKAQSPPQRSGIQPPWGTFQEVPFTLSSMMRWCWAWQIRKGSHSVTGTWSS